MTDSTEREELKPCPFCANERPRMEMATGQWWVACGMCGTEGPVRTSEDKAVALNRRPHEAAKGDG